MHQQQAEEMVRRTNARSSMKKRSNTYAGVWDAIADFSPDALVNVAASPGRRVSFELEAV